MTVLTRRDDEHPELQDVSLPPPELQLQRSLAAARCPPPQSPGQSVFLALLSTPPPAPGPGSVYEQDDQQDFPDIAQSHIHRLLQRAGRHVHPEDEEAGGGD